MAKIDADYALVKHCLRGEPRAFEQLVDKYQKPIFNVAYRMVRDYDDAEDIAQNAFVKAYENLSAYNPKHKFFSWLYRMAVNEALNFLKQKNRLQGLSEDLQAGEQSPDKRYEEAELSESLHDALMELKVDHRAAIVLKHFEDLSYRDIGYILEIPEKTVKSRLFTARQLLRDILIKKGLVSK